MAFQPDPAQVDDFAAFDHSGAAWDGSGTARPSAARYGPFKAHWATGPGLGGCTPGPGAPVGCDKKEYPDVPLLFNVEVSGATHPSGVTPPHRLFRRLRMVMYPPPPPYLLGAGGSERGLRARRQQHDAVRPQTAAGLRSSHRHAPQPLASRPPPPASRPQTPPLATTLLLRRSSTRFRARMRRRCRASYRTTRRRRPTGRARAPAPTASAATAPRAATATASRPSEPHRCRNGGTRSLVSPRCAG